MHTITNAYRHDQNRDGIFENTYRQVETFDAQERLVFTSTQGDYDGDGEWNFVNETENEYGEYGFIVSSVSRYDWQADGKFDQVETTEQDWREIGGNIVLLSRIVQKDWQNDGLIDHYDFRFNSYDDGGRIVEALQIYDWNADGEADLTDRYAYRYDGGRLSEQTIDYGDDGIIDVLIETEYFLSPDLPLA